MEERIESGDGREGECGRGKIIPGKSVGEWGRGGKRGREGGGGGRGRKGVKG